MGEIKGAMKMYNNQFIYTNGDGVKTVPLEKLAEMVAQMDEETLDVFVKDWEVDLDRITLDFYNRMVHRAKTYESRYWGLISFLLLNDYTSAREVMLRVEAGRLEPIDKQIHYLFLQVNNLNNSGSSVSSDMEALYKEIYKVVSKLIQEYDLHSGYFRRNTKSLKSEWEELEMYNNRIRHNVQTTQAMYEALWAILKFRVYMIAMMPRVAIG